MADQIEIMSQIGLPMKPDSIYWFRCADAVEWLREWPDESVDLVITDPAYESLEKYRTRGTITCLTHSKSSSNDWFTIFPNERFSDLIHEIYRVLKPNSHFYMLCDQETMFLVKPIGESVGFKFWKPIVWDKGKIGMGYHYRARYEFVLFFEKGKRKLNDLGVPDVLAFDRVWKGYPTEKLVDLLRVFVRQSSKEGGLVMDPFIGSGSTSVAALRENRRATGCDVSADAVDISTMRADQVILDRQKIAGQDRQKTSGQDRQKIAGPIGTRSRCTKNQ